MKIKWDVHEVSCKLNIRFKGLKKQTGHRFQYLKNALKIEFLNSILNSQALEIKQSIKQ